MTELCFNSMNRSAYILGEEDPDLPGQIEAAAEAGFRLFGPDEFSIARYCAEGNRVETLAEKMADVGMRTFELPTLMVNDDRDTTRAAIDRPEGRIRRAVSVETTSTGALAGERASSSVDML